MTLWNHDAKFLKMQTPHLSSHALDEADEEKSVCV